MKIKYDKINANQYSEVADMRIADGYILRNVAGSNVVVPVGDRGVDFTAIISVNETGAFIWKQLENETTKENILAAMLNDYDVDEQRAKADIEKFISTMREAGLLNE